MFTKLRKTFSLWMLKRLILKHASKFSTSMTFNQAPELSEHLQKEKGHNPSNWVRLNSKAANKIIKWAKRLGLQSSVGIYEDWYNQPHTAHISHGWTIGVMLSTHQSTYASELLLPTSVSCTNIGIFIPLSVEDTGLGIYESPLDAYTFNGRYYKPNPKQGYWYSKTTYDALETANKEWSSEQDFRTYQKSTIH